MCQIKKDDLVLIDGNKFGSVLNINDDKTYIVEIIYFKENVIETVTENRIKKAIKNDKVQNCIQWILALPTV